MLPDCGSQSRSGNVPFMALVPGFAVTFQACLIHELPACPEPVQPKPLVWGGAAKKVQDALRLIELAWTCLDCALGSATAACK